jgi:hypothetical protein
MRARWSSAGSAGLALSVGTTAGPIAGLGFGLLAVIWIYVTGQGWLTARARRFDEHRRWMIRSFALTFAAVTLRIYMPLSGLAHLQMDEAYRAIAWLAWVPQPDRGGTLSAARPGPGSAPSSCHSADTQLSAGRAQGGPRAKEPSHV